MSAAFTERSLPAGRKSEEVLMVRIEEHKQKIAEVEQQICASKSWKRRRDLIKYKRRLVKELETAERFLKAV